MDPNWVSRKIAEFYQAPDKNMGDAQDETERTVSIRRQTRAEFSGAATCRFPGWNRVGRLATDFAPKTLLRDGNQPACGEDGGGSVEINNFT